MWPILTSTPRSFWTYAASQTSSRGRAKGVFSVSWARIGGQAKTSKSPATRMNSSKTADETESSSSRPSEGTRCEKKTDPVHQVAHSTHRFVHHDPSDRHGPDCYQR